MTYIVPFTVSYEKKLCLFLRDMDLPSQRLLRGGSISVTDGMSG